MNRANGVVSVFAMSTLGLFCYFHSRKDTLTLVKKGVNGIEFDGIEFEY